MTAERVAFLNAAAPEQDDTEETRVAAPAQTRPFKMAALYAALLLQGASALIFGGELWTEILGLRDFAIPWAVQEVIQVLASVGLLVGVAVTTIFVFRIRSRIHAMHRQMDAASGNFETHLDSYFAEWALSRSEREVALYAMKGFSNGEIADLRGTAAATVKSQMNSIYRKSGLANRQQLIAFLVEELLTGVAIAPRAAS